MNTGRAVGASCGIVGAGTFKTGYCKDHNRYFKILYPPFNGYLLSAVSLSISSQFAMHFNVWNSISAFFFE
jgi:hypothetical protein